MDLSSLRVFVDVMRQGSFAGVARDRNVDPSSISRAIAALEEELGVRLFQRTTRRLTGTEAGDVYFQRIAPLVEGLESAALAATDVAQEPGGTLRVSAAVSFGLERIVPALPALAARYPQLDIELLLDDSVADVLAERIDVAVRHGPLADSGLVAELLLRTSYAVAASPEYLARRGAPEQPQDLTGHDALVFALDGFRSRWLFRDAGGLLSEVPVRSRVQISNAMALRRCALAGMGVALLPRWYADADFASGRLVRLFTGFDVTATEFETSIWLVYPSRAYLPLKVRVFVDHLKRELGGADG